MNFDGLYERARERGWTLSKPTETARYGTMPIRYILKDDHGLMHFRSLDEVERRLNAKAARRSHNPLELGLSACAQPRGPNRAEAIVRTVSSPHVVHKSAHRL